MTGVLQRVWECAVTVAHPQRQGQHFRKGGGIKLPFLQRLVQVQAQLVQQFQRVPVGQDGAARQVIQDGVGFTPLTGRVQQRL